MRPTLLYTYDNTGVLPSYVILQHMIFNDVRTPSNGYCRWCTCEL
jgi:hypothetical protein